MFKKITVIMSIAFLLLLSACSGTDNKTENGESSKEQKTLRVGSTAQSYPNGYEENGKLVGFDIEVLEKIAENLGYQVEWVRSDFAGLMGQLETKKLIQWQTLLQLQMKEEKSISFQSHMRMQVLPLLQIKTMHMIV